MEESRLTGVTFFVRYGLISDLLFSLSTHENADIVHVDGKESKRVSVKIFVIQYSVFPDP